MNDDSNSTGLAQVISEEIGKMGLISVVAKIGSLGGMIIFAFYLGQIHFTPTGVTVGDAWMFAMIFIAAVLLLGILNLWVLPTGYVIHSGIRYLSRLPKRKRREYFIERMKQAPYAYPALSISMMGMVILAALSWLKNWWVPALVAFLCLIAFAFASIPLLALKKEPDADIPTIWIYRGDPNKTVKKVGFRLLLSQFLILGAVAISGVGTDFFNSIMRFVGIRQESMEVRLPRDISNLLKSRIPEKLQKGLLTDIPGISSSDGYAYWKVDILFHGIGSSSCIEVRYGTDSYSLSIPNKDLIILRK